MPNAAPPPRSASIGARGSSGAAGIGALGREGFSIVRWFAALSLVCVIVSAAGTAHFLGAFLTDQMLQRDADVSSEFVNSIVRAEGTWSYFSDPNSAVARVPLESFFNHISKLPSVLRANVYATDGVVLWSSDASLIGRRFGENDDLAAALRGRVAVEVGEVPKEEHVALDSVTAGRRFTESYLPVFDNTGRRVVGVVEIYRVPDALFRSIDAGVLLIRLSAAGSAVLLYAALMGIALRASTVMTRQQRRMTEAEALAAIGAIASAVAHGIRNPLASIRSSAEFAMREDEAGTRECLTDIQDEVDRLEGWVRDLLIQARGEAVEHTAVDVNLLLAASIRSFTATAERQQVRVRMDTGAVPPVRASAASLAQAIDNLVANAIEAMPEGGELRLETALDRGGREVRITVTDTGGGLPAAVGGDAPPLFWSTKARGTGLGLALTRRILSHFGGSLRLESTQGVGTRAIITLPAAA